MGVPIKINSTGLNWFRTYDSDKLGFVPVAGDIVTFFQHDFKAQVTMRLVNRQVDLDYPEKGVVFDMEELTTEQNQQIADN